MGIFVNEQVDEIISMYDMPEDSSKTENIRKFLEVHEHLFPILEEAKEKIISVFGSAIRINLELFHDVEEGWEQLYVIIKSSYNVQKIVELENRLVEEWFLDKMKDTQGYLNISGEPI